MRRFFLCVCFCLCSSGCVLFSKKDFPSLDPVGVFSHRVGSDYVVAFVNQTDSPIYFSLNWKMASYGKEEVMEDGSCLITPEFTQDIVTSVPVNGWFPVRLLPFEPALASTPITTNGCRLCDINLLWQVFSPLPGKEPDCFPKMQSNFLKTEWNWWFGNGSLSGDVFTPIPLENRDIEYEYTAWWKDGVYVGDMP